MRKSICAALALVLVLGTVPAVAETDLSNRSVASGNVAAVTFEDITAPWSGTLLPFDWQAGDRVEAGEKMFELRTETVYAPETGKVETVFAREGEDAAAVIGHYGALIALEAEHPDWIQATTNGAYTSKKENRVLHAGEEIWFRSDKADREEGTGRVVSVNEKGEYTVEIQSGSFEVTENLNLFRSSDRTPGSKVGSGRVFRRNPIAVTGMGRIAKILVSEGETVSANQPLMILQSADADPGASAEIRAEQDGVVEQLFVTPGTPVRKGQALARVRHTAKLEVIADVDEVDLAGISVGTVCPVVLDMDPDTQLNGTVTKISGIGVTKQNAAYFQVHFSLDRTDLPLGASASVYLPKE